MNRSGYVDACGVYEDWCDDLDCGECDYCVARQEIDNTIKCSEGQAFLREMVDAISKEPGLCSGVLGNLTGSVCAIGAVLKQRGVEFEREDDEYDTDYDAADISRLANIPESLAREIMYENDEFGSSPEKTRDWMVGWAKRHLVD